MLASWSGQSFSRDATQAKSCVNLILAAGSTL
jgi:hypothetical protein